MLTIQVKVDFTKLVTGYKQLPFATALALTRTAQDAQTEVRRQLPQRFIIRNSFVSTGIRIVAATKTTLESAVYSKDDFMVRQELGGMKTPRGGSSIAVPESVRTNKRGIVTSANRPRQVLNKPGTFIATIGGVRGIWQRKGGKRNPIALLFALVPLVQVPARFEFKKTVLRIVDSRFARQFQLAWLQSVRTAR